MLPRDTEFWRLCCKAVAHPKKIGALCRYRADFFPVAGESITFMVIVRKTKLFGHVVQHDVSYIASANPLITHRINSYNLSDERLKISYYYKFRK